MKLSRYLCWLFIAVILPAQSKPIAQDFKVLVLDALNGKPQPGVEVHYFCVGPPLNSHEKSALTSADGLAKITYSCGEEQRMELSLIPPNKKEECGSQEPFTFPEVSSLGFVGKPNSDGNIWCPTKVSRTLKPLPGQVIMFVKKPTWYQSHVAG